MTSIDYQAEAERRLGTLGKFVFGLGDHTVNLALTSLSLVFMFFLTDVAKLEPLWAGAVVWTARVFDAVTDPLMGRISDRTTWRRGRRRPYFLIGALPLGIFFGLVWRTPFSEQLPMFLYYTTTYMGISLSLTILSVPYMALLPELALGYDERTSLNTFRGMLTIIGSILAASIFVVAEMFGGGAQGYGSAGLAFAVWLVIPWPFVYAVTFERRSLSKAPVVPLRQALSDLIAHKNYWRLCALYIMSRVAIDVGSLTFPYFYSHWLMRPEDKFPALFSMLGTVVVALPIWLQISKHYEKHRLFIFGCSWWIVCNLVMFTAQPDWSRLLMLIFPGVIGIGFAAVDLMPWSMLGESIDEGELRNGSRSDGVYSGFFTFFRKAAGATATLIAGAILQLTGYQEEQRPESAVFAIRILMSLVPAACLAVAIVLARGYPLTRARHVEIRTQLAARRSQP